MDGKNCPICGVPLGEYYTVSRKDDRTYICHKCGEKECFLESFREENKEVK